MLKKLRWLPLALLIVYDAMADQLQEAMAKAGVRSAVVVVSQAVDEQPYWSSDSRHLAVNIEGSWWKVDLVGLSLKEGTWNETDPIGVAVPPPKPEKMKESEVDSWKSAAVADPRKVTTRAGTTIELEQEELGTLFRITRKGRKPDVLWKTSLENCHGLALSPDQANVAYVCELTGVMVTAVDP